MPSLYRPSTDGLIQYEVCSYNCFTCSESRAGQCCLLRQQEDSLFHHQISAVGSCSSNCPISLPFSRQCTPRVHSEGRPKEKRPKSLLLHSLSHHTLLLLLQSEYLVIRRPVVKALASLALYGCSSVQRKATMLKNMAVMYKEVSCVSCSTALIKRGKS